MACALPHILFFLLFLLPLSTVAQTNGTVATGASITATDKAIPWLSPSEDFAFGFKQLQDKDLFLLSIWYYKIPDRTIVWYANPGVPVPSGSKVVLTANRGLVLSDPQGRELWNSETILNEVTHGFMNDSGNFVLVRSDSVNLWESFKYPTDTMLPTQIMESGGVLFSRQTETNFSRGRFQLRLLGDGNLVLNTRELATGFTYDAYYWSNTYDADNTSNRGYQVIFNETGYFFVLRRNNRRVDLTPQLEVPTGDYYHRVTLNFDGVLNQYYHPKTATGNSKWTAFWYQPENICLAISGIEGIGACGYNSICTLNDYGRPECSCPAGFSLVDPNDKYGSCKPSFTPSCEEYDRGSAEDVYGILELKDTTWPTSNYEQLRPSSEDMCSKSCLQDCFCAVAIFRDNGCWKKKLPLSNGRKNASVNTKSFMKYRKGDPLPSPTSPRSPVRDTKKNNRTLILVVSVLLGSSLFVNFVLICVFRLGFFLSYHKKFIKIPNSDSTAETNLRCFTYKELVEATGGFKEELGRGAFGIVYKGVIQTSGSGNAVAVKKLDGVIQNREKEFRTEVHVIGQTHHKNLLHLIGFCDEGEHRMLVYEFLSNGALSSFLFGDMKPSWSQRSQIALGIARGLLYLHEECSTQIIHCDIKPQNILLDDCYNARIADFGLAKLLMINQSQTNTGIRGTKGYVAPEWFRSKPITAKVDVYSYGVLLLEIISCRKSVGYLEFHSGDEKAILTDWACDCFLKGRLDDLVGDDMEALNDWNKVERFLMVGLWCIQEDPSLRPTMKKVTQMLEGVVEVEVPPCPSQFSFLS
ncbi:G-type lectin S-receptor-like serine/threonine-protein kinase LECRK3 [Actinidia eriantha]|uniref:G-type lectin S-receptor-like serine/threonine-protein kinase LECRK3 n=1 Tax=Actinidia eriantha TaxID=165200 RepID=UPI0025887DFA|nr:G-type lectin S-receptor-like serine/threonine-protein kinase LECRK3 [Actinidia eriantha]XP_057509622.1 G-type lectin S-receptor-like serine/threonine-protein kinase LECRK3 [Actinidia eriantha]XP_057509623.1 G-type lectin S-receptor-like serine/threonine-protein kinase LECRK3 [Actinidia eriantha]XP_057509624.1 G-type lectin S-receptor-like serine/threonine-protein kinase LECRK3 [Actinidia eriantha]XP_057509625.1 G-type lectin S-receptor-like serine/threonine-protein kinase LECRK3 [Actinidia 